MLLGRLARIRFGDEGAFWSTAILATMPLVVILGRSGTLDALLALHVLAVVALDMGPGREDDRPGLQGLAVGCLLGLAFLIKGPVGVLLPLLIMLGGRTASGREILPRLRTTAQALAGWCLIVLPWGLSFLRRVGATEVLATLRVETAERYFAGTTHVEPAWFYLPIVVVGFLPWAAPLFVALGRLVVGYRDPATRTARYAAAGLVLGLVFFSFGKSKLPQLHPSAGAARGVGRRMGAGSGVTPPPASNPRLEPARRHARSVRRRLRDRRRDAARRSARYRGLDRLRDLRAGHARGGARAGG